MDSILSQQSQRSEKQWEAGGGAPSKEAMLAEIEARIEAMLDQGEEGEDAETADYRLKLKEALAEIDDNEESKE